MLVHQVDREGRTALHIACLNGNSEATALLLRANANVNAMDTMGVTPLLVAQKEGHTECIDLLVSAMGHRKSFKEHA